MLVYNIKTVNNNWNYVIIFIQATDFLITMEKQLYIFVKNINYTKRKGTIDRIIPS